MHIGVQNQHMHYLALGVQICIVWYACMLTTVAVKQVETQDALSEVLLLTVHSSGFHSGCGEFRHSPHLAEGLPQLELDSPLDCIIIKFMCTGTEKEASTWRFL